MNSLPVNDAAKRLGVSRRTIYYWLRDGYLESVPVREGQRVTLASIEAIEQDRKGTQAA